MEEELIASFSSNLKFSSGDNDTAAPHPRLSDFKSGPPNMPDQNKRREQMFERQKRKRLDAINYARKLVEGNLSVNDLDDEMDISDKKSHKGKKFSPFKDQLMLSEWLVDVPEDFSEEWIMTVCPVGKRCLVVASRGKTCAYTKSGYCVNRFPSLLPGGSKATMKPGDYTILDCIYSDVERVFYVIDLTCWRGHPVYDSETEFRCYWLKSKLADQEGLADKSRLNPYKFIQAPCFGCSVGQIQEALEATYSFEIDGLLFYHKRTHYTPGRTPLVGWLKPHMITDILGIDLPARFANTRPPVDKLKMLKANSVLKKSGRDRGSMDVDNHDCAGKIVTDEPADVVDMAEGNGSTL